MTNTPADEGNRSLKRGLAVLDCVYRHRSAGVRVAEIVQICALQRATVYRMLATLVAEGYVARQDRFRYVTGARFDRPLDVPVDDLAARLQPVLRQVSRITEDAAFAVVREGSQSHCIARQIGTFPVQVLVVQVGRRQPLGVGAAGLALLASLARDDAAAIVAANAPVLGAFGGMTPERMFMLLKSTRERGWSVIGNHVVADTLGVGCAILNAAGLPIAALSVAAPIQRMSPQRQSSIAKTIRESLRNLLPDRS